MTTVSLPPVKPDLDVLLDAALRTGGETNRFDFKETLDLGLDDHKVRLVRAIGAFANTDDGGFLLIGVSDDRRVVGVSESIAATYDQTRVHRIAAQYLAPPPALQVRHHEREGRRVIIIEIPSFEDVPCVVRQSATFGQEKIVAGTILFRTNGAESAALTSEASLRMLCDTIVRRRASAVVDLIQRGTLGRPQQRAPEPHDVVKAVRERANTVWSEADGAKPFIEVGFAPQRPIRMTAEQLKDVIPNVCIPTEHGFPFHTVVGAEVTRAMPWGLYGRIPFAPFDDATLAPTYLWLLLRNMAFVYREHMWEDSPQATIPGGVGVFHLLGNIILVIRFLGSLASAVSLEDDETIQIWVALNNVKGRYLEYEDRGTSSPWRKHASENRIDVQSEITLAQIRRSPQDVALELAEEAAWQLGRDDLRRYDFEQALKRAPSHLGREYRLAGQGG